MLYHQTKPQPRRELLAAYAAALRERKATCAMTTIYFIRHGESEANVLRRFDNRADGLGLTARGLRQAKQLALALAGCGVRHVYASPVLRARQTAEILAGALAAPLTIAAALREYDVGELEGRDDDAAWAIYWEAEDAWLRGDLAARPPGGESALDMRARLAPFVAAVVARHARDPAVALVGHGGLYRNALPALLPNVAPPFAREHSLANTAFVVADALPGSLRCIAWAGIAL